MKKIVSIGDLTQDIVFPVQMPVHPGQSQQLPWYGLEPGGAGNFLITGQRLGTGHDVQLYSVGTIGDDMFGHHVVEVLRSEGVNVDGTAILKGMQTTVVAVLFEPDAAGGGKFSYVWHSDTTHKVNDAEVFTPATKAIIDQADVLFTQGFSLYEPSLRPLIAYAFASSRSLVYDVGPGTDIVPQELRIQVRERAQVIITTEDELPLIADGLTGEAAYKLLLKGNMGLLVIKRGAKGCRLVSAEYTRDIPAFSVQARDLIGAGDSFNAAFLYAVVNGLSPFDAATLANATGAAKIQKLGTGRSMPTRIEIEAVLQGKLANF